MTSTDAIVTEAHKLGEPLPHSPDELRELLEQWKAMGRALARAGTNLADGLRSGSGPLDGFMVEPSVTTLVDALGQAGSDTEEAAGRALAAFEDEYDQHIAWCKERGMEGWLTR